MKVNRFIDFSEEEKTARALSYALTAAQGFLLNPVHAIPELKEYRIYLQGMIDWIAEKEGLGNIRLY